MAARVSTAMQRRNPGHRRLAAAIILAAAVGRGLTIPREPSA